jgi:histidine ammonia-lyase
MSSRRIVLDGRRLTIEQAVLAARTPVRVSLSSSAVRQMERSRRWVENAVRRRDIVYGVTTGFGWFQNVSIPREKLQQLQRNLILSHCAGVGEPFPEEVVRAMLLLRSNALARGVSGIRVAAVRMMLELLNRGVHPVVPEQGSVGASGDLAPLSHLAAVLLGEGEAIFRGRRMPGGEALKAAGLKALVLEAKEGLALNNGTQAMTALGVLALHDAEVLADVADSAAAMTLAAVKGKTMPFLPRVHELRPHAGQAVSARAIRRLVKGSRLVDGIDDDTRGKVQDSYSLRCASQVHGASRDALGYVRGVLETEINSATDNPLIVVADDIAYNAGNFHGQPVALAMDFLGLAVAELGNISERRTAKILDRNHSFGLPPFLARHGGLESGLMIAQYTAASLVSENKVLIHPSSGDSIPTSANQEDHVSMGTTAARHARRIVRNVARVLAIELLCASRAIEARKDESGAGIQRVLRTIRAVVPRSEGDAPLSETIEQLAEMALSGAFGKTRS